MQEIRAAQSASCSTGEYGALVLIAVLVFSETTVAKLAGHAITPEEVRQVNDGDGS